MTLDNTTSAQDRIVEKYENFGGFEDILAILAYLDNELTQAKNPLD